MTILRLIRNNLVYYSRKNLLLALGVAISGAVLTGALVVGDSVEYSLNRIVDHRLGTLSHVLKAGDRYFTRDLPGLLRPFAGRERGGRWRGTADKSHPGAGCGAWF